MLNHQNHPTNIKLDQPMHPDHARAVLGTTTHIRSLLIPPAQAQQAPQVPNPAPQPPTNQETGTDMKAEMQGLESRIFDELGTLKQEIQKAQPQDANKELQDLKQQLQGIVDGNDQA